MRCRSLLAGIIFLTVNVCVAQDQAPLESKTTATIKGKVIYDGDPPPRRDFKEQMQQHKDMDHCLKGDTLDPTWTVGPDKGVANVVVWLRPPSNKYFKVPLEQQKPAEMEVVMDRPFCACVPHVVALFPHFFDHETKKQKATGQVFKFKNSSPIDHNFNYKGEKARLKIDGNLVFPATKGDKVSEQVIRIKACSDTEAGTEHLIRIKCDIHPWISAYAWAFDHPYAAVTKQDGTFEIKNAPAGVELEIFYWHESFDNPKVLKTITLKPGDTTENFPVNK